MCYKGRGLAPRKQFPNHPTCHLNALAQTTPFSERLERVPGRDDSHPAEINFKKKGSAFKNTQNKIE